VLYWFCPGNGYLVFNFTAPSKMRSTGKPTAIPKKPAHSAGFFMPVLLPRIHCLQYSCNYRIRNTQMNITIAPSKPCEFPEPLTPEAHNRLLMNARTAMYAALACADKTFGQAGITFVQDGRFTKAIHSECTVATFQGQFSKQVLLEAIRANIADDAMWVGTELAQFLRAQLKLPAGHYFSFDVARNVHEIKMRGSNKLSAFVTNPTAGYYNPDQVYAEFRVRMDECSALMIVKSGSQFGTGATFLAEHSAEVHAGSYEELAVKMTTAFNDAVGTQACEQVA